MARPIDADKLLEKQFFSLDDDGFGMMVVSVTDIISAPTVERKKGRWKDVKETSLYVPDMKYTVTHTEETCSACKARIGFIGSKPYLYDNICPNCGADMRGDGDES